MRTACAKRAIGLLSWTGLCTSPDKKLPTLHLFDKWQCGENLFLHCSVEYEPNQSAKYNQQDGAELETLSAYEHTDEEQ